MYFLKKIKIFFVCPAFIFLSMISAENISALSESGLYNQIRKLSNSSDKKQLQNQTTIFLKSYPKSRHAPSVELIRADNTENYQTAVKRYKQFISKNNNLKLNSYAQFRICSIYYLFASWKNLEYEANTGARLYKNTEYYNDFLFFKARTEFHKQNYKGAYSLCSRIVRIENKFYFYPEAKILFDYLKQKVNPQSDKYNEDLIFNYNHFKDTGLDISALFLLGRHFEYQRQHSNAYSAYSDIIKKYPKSPEARYSKERINQLIKYKPSYTSSYLQYSPSNDPFPDLSPEIEYSNEQKKNYYCIEIAPFYNLKNCEKISTQIRKSFTDVFIVRKKRFFSVYVGKIPNSETALNWKIRLAEEFGLNGNIIYVSNEGNLQYYYGDQ